MNLDAMCRFHLEVPTLIRKPRSAMAYGMRLTAILILSASAFAQYGGGGTTGTMGSPSSSGTYAPGTPGYGHGAAIGAGVGAAAAAAGAVYFMTHRARTITGCTEMSNDGLRLTDDKSKHTLAILPGNADIKAGERVELKGKIKKSAEGNQNFVVKKVAKDYGECRSQANASSGNQSQAQEK